MRRGLPALMDFYDEFKDRQKEFVILAFHDTRAEDLADLDQKLQNVKQSIWNGRDLPFPILLDDSGETLRRFGISSFPTLLVIDRNGRVMKHGNEATVRDRLMETDREVKKLISKLKRATRKKFAKVALEVAEAGGNKAGFALYQYARKKAKKDQFQAIFQALEKVGGLYGVRFFLGEHGLKSPEREVRLAAAKAIQEHGERHHLWPLAEFANAEEDPEVKAALREAIEALNQRD